MFKFIRDLSIKTKIIATSVLCAVLVGGSIVLFFPYNQGVQIEQQALEKAMAIATMTADNLATSVVFENQTTAKEILDVLKGNPDLLFAVVRTTSGNVFAKIVRTGNVNNLYGTAMIMQPLSRIKGSVAFTTVPIRSQQETVGWLSLGLSIRKAQRQIQRITLTAMLVATMLAVVIIFFSMLVAKAIAEPIQQITDASAQIAQGNFDVQLKVRSRDEVGMLTETFNGMCMQLKESIRNLALSEERYRLTFENVFDVIVVIDTTLRIVSVTPSVQWIMGYKPEELAGQKLKSLTQLVPEQRRKAIRALRALFHGAHVKDLEFVVLTKNGEYKNVEVTATALMDSHGVVQSIIASMRDTTERKRAEEEKKKLQEQLSRAEKMETIGLLAGGVAHDLNNMLGAIVGYPELLLHDLPDSSPLRPAIKAIKESGERAAAIVQDMLTLTRRGVAVREVVNLNALVRKYFESPEYAKLKEYHPQIEVHEHLDPLLFNMIGSPVHLLKVIANLVSNAAEAIPGIGSIKITTENRNVDTSLKRYEEIREGEYVVLRIEDNGIGIPEADLQRIFEPFYTKKVMGRSGTGLGMSVVWGTVKDHGGFIDLVSEQGRGTTITLYFPATRKELQEEKNTLSLDDIMGSGETILVVDDVALQRDIAYSVLTKLNYKVATVASGEEALAYLKRNSADLLVLDMIMDPGMDGLETYRKILELHPHQKAVIASGYSETERVREAQKLGAGAYVKKPYTIENLGKAVKRELQGRKHCV